MLEVQVRKGLVTLQHCYFSLETVFSYLLKFGCKSSLKCGSTKIPSQLKKKISF